jgi:hypothetical protein
MSLLQYVECLTWVFYRHHLCDLMIVYVRVDGAILQKAASNPMILWCVFGREGNIYDRRNFVLKCCWGIICLIEQKSCIFAISNNFFSFYEQDVILFSWQELTIEALKAKEKKARELEGEKFCRQVFSELVLHYIIWFHSSALLKNKLIVPLVETYFHLGTNSIMNVILMIILNSVSGDQNAYVAVWRWGSNP